jgi:hypothetical protein
MNDFQVIGIVIFIYLIMALFQYALGRLIWFFVSGDWSRDEDHFFYWMTGCLVSCVLSWGALGLIKLFS